MKNGKTQPEPGYVVATLTVTETGETWSLREVDRLLVIGAKADAEGPEDELIVVDASTNSILLPESYDIPDLGEAVWEAIDISKTRASVNARGKAA